MEEYEGGFQMSTEVNVGDYGRMMFEMMLTKKSEDIPEHWFSIWEEAKPLVEQLLELNSKMKPNCYKVSGHKTKNGKTILSDPERIEKARIKMWLTKGKSIKKGNKVWVLGGDLEMSPRWDAPCLVMMKQKDDLIIKVSHCGGEHLEKVSANQKILRAPKDWDQNYEMYQDDTYWLEQAENLGI